MAAALVKTAAGIWIWRRIASAVAAMLLAVGLSAATIARACSGVSIGLGIMEQEAPGYGASAPEITEHWRKDRLGFLHPPENPPTDEPEPPAAQELGEAPPAETWWGDEDAEPKK